MNAPRRFGGLLLAAILVVASCKKERSCESCLTPGTPGNLPPVAKAGRDTTILLPQDSVLLDGSASTDADGHITAYQWSRLDGPASALLVQAASVKSVVRTLVAGVYHFELTVTDNGGLSAKDTVQITVGEAASTGSCTTNRPLVSAKLTPVGDLSQLRSEVAVAAVRNKILFAGGYIPGGAASSRVDVLDVTNESWTTARLSLGRWAASVAVLGDKVFFAGGYANGQGSSRVDIYDAATNTWSTAELSEGRALMAAAAVGTKVLFAGGVTRNWVYSPRVDIYDAATNSWSVATLAGRTPTGTVGVAATVVGNKVYFAGEGSRWLDWNAGSFSTTINVYDATANRWSTEVLSQPRGFMAAIATGGRNYWAGGVYQPLPQAFTNVVEIRDMATGATSFGCLFEPNAFFSAVQRGTQIIFFTGAGTAKNKFDLFDTATNTWSVGVLPQTVEEAFIVACQGNVYVAGGAVNGVATTQVWKLEF